MSNKTQNARPSVEQIKHELAVSRIKSLFNWGELSRLLSGTRSVVLKDKYPKKHEPFINDLCDAVKPVLIKYGYEAPDTSESAQHAE